MLSIIHAECRKKPFMLIVVMASAGMLNVVLASAVMMNVVMACAVMLNVGAPLEHG
jgi:hypothetical protein